MTTYSGSGLNFVIDHIAEKCGASGLPKLDDGKDYKKCCGLCDRVDAKLEEFGYKNRGKPENKKGRKYDYNTNKLPPCCSRRILKKHRILIDINTLKFMNITIGEDKEHYECIQLKYKGNSALLDERSVGKAKIIDDNDKLVQ